MCIIICITLLFQYQYVGGTHKVAFLKDYLTKMSISGALESHLCWEKDDLLKLERSLSNNGFRFTLNTKSVLINNKHFDRMFIVDMKCDFFDNLIEKALRKELFRFPYKWIIFGNINTFKTKKYFLPINSFAIIIEEMSQNNSLKLQSLYKIFNGSNYYENDISIWTKEKGFLFYNDLTLIKNRTNFFKMPLRVSYVILDNGTLEGIQDNRNKHIDKLTKINYLMFEHFVDIWNMTHSKLFRPDWGLEFHPEKLYYKGMLGDLLYGRADIAGTLSFTPPERLKYFRYLLNTLKGSECVFVFRAPPLPHSKNMFILPFSLDVWISSVIVLCLCCLVLWIIIRWERTQNEIIVDLETNAENFPNFQDVVMMQLAVVCQMDYVYTSRTTAGKMATFCLLSCFSYIYTAYAARIVILLQSTANNLNNARALYDANMEIGVEDTPYNQFYFSKPAKRTDEVLRQLIYKNRMANKGKNRNFFNAEEGMKLVQDTYFAFHTERNTASNLVEARYTETQKCSVRIVPTIFKGDIPHISCPRNSTFIEYFLIGLNRLHETGVHSRENRRKLSNIKCTGRQTIFLSLGLIESYFAFAVYIVGLVLSLIILCCELIVNIWFKNRQKASTVLVVRPLNKVN